MSKKVVCDICGCEIKRRLWSWDTFMYRVHIPRAYRWVNNFEDEDPYETCESLDICPDCMEFIMAAAKESKRLQKTGEL